MEDGRLQSERHKTRTRCFNCKAKLLGDLITKVSRSKWFDREAARRNDKRMSCHQPAICVYFKACGFTNALNLTVAKYFDFNVGTLMQKQVNYLSRTLVTEKLAECL